jgi:peptide deformylase
MSKKIIKYPDPILRKKCEEVRRVTEEIRSLGFEMIEIMTENEGIGLAAPQVGELKRIIVVQTEKGSEIFINPKIIKKSKETIIDEEGCLSFPGLFLKIKRAKEVEIEALNERGEKIQVRAEGLPARIFQHEIDHLDGILFIDRLSFWQRFKIKRKLRNLQSNSK